jgi:hypothetical protein
MSFYESVYFLWWIVSVAVEIAVMYVAFPLWRKRRLRFALLFAWGALVGLFGTLFAHYTWYFQLDIEHREFVWCASQILSLITVVAYATAVVLLVRHFRVAPEGPPIPPTGLENPSS